jgi:heme A synthase
LTPTQTLANVVGGMLLIQVVLGGAAVLINDSYTGYHIVWGVLTFAVLIALAVVSARSLGAKSIVFRLSIAVIVDYVIQGILGFASSAYGDQLVLIHLTNAFILAVLATTLISYNRSIAPIEAKAHAIESGKPAPKQ